MKKTKKRKTTKNERRNNHSLFVAISCAALITVGVVLLFFSFYAVYKVYDVPMELEVSDTSGFNTDIDGLRFGKAQPGNSNTRTMVLSHDYKRPLLIHFKKSGNISGFISVPDEFYLAPNYSHEIALSARVPEGTAHGRYEGNLKVYFRRI